MSVAAGGLSAVRLPARRLKRRMRAIVGAAAPVAGIMAMAMLDALPGAVPASASAPADPRSARGRRCLAAVEGDGDLPGIERGQELAGIESLARGKRAGAADAAVQDALQRGQQIFLQHTGDPALSRDLSVAVLEKIRTQQALSLAFFDIFFASAVVSALLVFLILLMKRAVAEKGAHLAAE